MGTSIQLNGGTVLTIAGRNALRDAELTGRSAVPKYYKVSSQDYPLDPSMAGPAFNGWRQHDIDAYVPVDPSTAQFTVQVPQAEATDDMLTVGIFLEDGTLFGIAKPPYAMPRGITQVFHILHEYDGINELLDFRYLPIEAMEQELAILDTILTQGEATMKEMAHSRRITKIQGVPVQ